MFKESDESDAESDDNQSGGEQHELDLDDVEEIIRDPGEHTDMDWHYADYLFQSEVEDVKDSQSRNTVR